MASQEKEPISEEERAKWHFLPEPIIIEVFKLMTVMDVIRCSECCRRWNLVSEDQMLWKYLLTRDFRVKNKSAVNEKAMVKGFNWKDEYIRLRDTGDFQWVQTLKGHTDEVLHVSFSNDGKQIASCSKDRKLIIWNITSSLEFETYYVHDMVSYGWLHTWAAQYSPDDSKLMLAGVVNQVGGELAIFKTGRGGDEKYVYLCRVVNDPYDVLGCWASERLFVSGTMSADFFADLEASIWLNEPPDTPDISPQNSILAGNGEMVDLPQQPHLNLTCYKGLLFKFRNVDGSVYLRYVQCFSRKNYAEEYEWPNPTDEVLNERTEQQQDEEQTIDDEACLSSLSNAKLCAVFLCGDKTSIPHQLGFQRISADRLNFPPSLQTPEKVIDFHGHVIGMAISSDHTKLYVNVRSWPENCKPSVAQPPPIATNIDMHVVNLRTMELTDQVFTGHCGFTPSENAFYLYLDLSEKFVASGSENCRGYVWDKEFGSILSTLEHDACVNCVTFNPQNEQMCVSASDDGTMKVWQSRQWIRARKKENGS